jgi:hypothetical protein
MCMTTIVVIVIALVWGQICMLDLMLGMVREFTWTWYLVFSAILGIAMGGYLFLTFCSQKIHEELERIIWFGVFIGMINFKS